MDSIIKYNGQKIDLNRIKNILMNHELIEDVEIKLWSNDEVQEGGHHQPMLIIYITLKKRQDKFKPELYMELNQYIKLNVNNLEIKFKIEILDDFEKSDSGKILKEKLPRPSTFNLNNIQVKLN